MVGRFFGGLAILVVGFDLIWLGCKSNGADNDRNPVWGFLDGFLTFQEYVLGFAAAVGLAFVGWYFWNEVMTSREHRSGTLDRSYNDHPDYTVTPERHRSWSPTPAPKVPEPEVLRNLESNFKAEAAQQLSPTSPKPAPQKPKLTAKELKEKAIQELLGRY